MDGLSGIKAAASAMPNESLCKCLPAWARFLCFGLSFFLGFAFCSAALGKADQQVAFYCLWIFGVLGAWLGTMFIKSPQKQFAHMTKSIDNIICNVLILVCFIINLVLGAVNIGTKWWAMLAPYVILYAALVWYSLSLIPGLQGCCRSCIKSCFSCCKPK